MSKFCRNWSSGNSKPGLSRWKIRCAGCYFWQTKRETKNQTVPLWDLKSGGDTEVTLRTSQVGFPVCSLGVVCRERGLFKWRVWFYRGNAQSLALRASLIAQLVKNLPAMQETQVWFLGREDPWRRDRLSTPIYLGFPGGSAGKESACNAADLGSIPGLGRSPGEGKGYPLQYSGLENSMDYPVHGVTESDTTERLSLSLFFLIAEVEPTRCWTTLWDSGSARALHSLISASGMVVSVLKQAHTNQLLASIPNSVQCTHIGCLKLAAERMFTSWKCATPTYECSCSRRASG